MVTIKELLLQILTIAQYPRDKEQFITNFEAYNQLEAILKVIKKLPEETQEIIKSLGDDHEQMLRYIPEEMFREAYIHITEREIENLLQTITSTLSLKQKQSISRLFSQNQKDSVSYI